MRGCLLRCFEQVLGGVLLWFKSDSKVRPGVTENETDFGKVPAAALAAEPAHSDRSSPHSDRSSACRRALHSRQPRQDGAAAALHVYAEVIASPLRRDDHPPSADITRRPAACACGCGQRERRVKVVTPIELSKPVISSAGSHTFVRRRPARACACDALARAAAWPPGAPTTDHINSGGCRWGRRCMQTPSA